MIVSPALRYLYVTNKLPSYKQKKSTIQLQSIDFINYVL